MGAILIMANSGPLKWTPKNLISEVHDIVNNELEKEAPRAVNEIRENFTRGTSEPGEPPGIKSGTLYRGIQAKVIRGRRKLLIGADTSVTYALALEIGAASKGLRARPYLRPQRMRSKERLIKILNKVLK